MVVVAGPIERKPIENRTPTPLAHAAPLHDSDSFEPAKINYEHARNAAAGKSPN